MLGTDYICTCFKFWLLHSIVCVCCDFSDFSYTMLKPEDPACYNKTNRVSKASHLSSEPRNLNQLITIKLETLWLALYFTGLIYLIIISKYHWKLNQVVYSFMWNSTFSNELQEWKCGITKKIFRTCNSPFKKFASHVHTYTVYPNYTMYTQFELQKSIINWKTLSHPGSNLEK